MISVTAPARPSTAFTDREAEALIHAIG